MIAATETAHGSVQRFSAAPIIAMPTSVVSTEIPSRQRNRAPAAARASTALNPEKDTCVPFCC